MANTKKSTTKNTTKSSKNNKSGIDLKNIIILAIGVLSAIFIYNNGSGIIGGFIREVAYMIVGYGSFLLPIIIIYISLINMSKLSFQEKRSKKIHTVFIFIVFITLLHSITFKTYMSKSLIDEIDYIRSNITYIHGGIISTVIYKILYTLFGGIGATFLILALLIIDAIFLFNIDITEYIDFHNFDIRNIISKKLKQKKTKEKMSDTVVTEIAVDNNSTKKKFKAINVPDLEQTKVDLSKDTQREIKVTMSQENKGDEVIKAEINEELSKKISEAHAEEHEYVFPTLDFLNENVSGKINKEDKKDLLSNAAKLEETLSSFGVDAKVTQVTKGPAVTRFELQPPAGVKVSKIVNLSDDIALGLAAKGVRIEAPIPGKAAVGIEVPNKDITAVFLKEVLSDASFINSKHNLSIGFGKDIAGNALVADLTKMPHVLIAGATGSGKSVCINTLIISLLYKYSPKEVKLLMVDPKVVELNIYNGIPHLLIPVVTEPKKAAGALNWAVNEMTRRYKLFADNSVRNIEGYNELFEKGKIQEKLPWIVMIIDELADLMMVCANDIEDYIGRLAQMARAAGMHLVIATQRPSVDIITGVIKANIPSRISFAVSSQIDSRTILDSVGAEKLLGRGDMLFYPSGQSKPTRVQGAFISEEEVERIVEFIKGQHAEAEYKEDIIEHINNSAESGKLANGDEDELLEEAIRIISETGQVSASYIQRRLRIGYNRAARIMEQLEDNCIISQRDGSKPRQLLVSIDQYLEAKRNK